MRVNVYIKADAVSGDELLATPYGPLSAIPKHLASQPWRMLATTTTEDPLLLSSALDLKAEIAKSGFAVIKPGKPAPR